MMDLSSFFEPFAEIDAKSRNIIINIKDVEKYHAHRCDSKKAELLQEHVNLVADYALKLSDVNKLDTVVNQLLASLVNDINSVDKKKVQRLLKQMFWHTIVFHDFGKLNENFQIHKMENHKGFIAKKNHIDSQHSILSAFLFTSYHFNELENSLLNDDKSKLLIIYSSLLLSTTILRHHSSNLFLNEHFNETVIESLTDYLYHLQLANNPKFSQVYKIKNYQMLMRNGRNHFGKEAEFIFFSLLKLNFSLLTAADYYATTEYMSDLSTTDFGILTTKTKEEIYQHYWNYKYNAALRVNYPVYRNGFNWSSVKKRNQQNLNRLRNKIMVDALESIRQNAEENVFYLEAPTGAGKTNLSLALALELLKANSELNKIYYVFPFTTLVTQTFTSIKNTLNLNNDQIIQLHSRAGFHQKNDNADEADAEYGKLKRNFIDNMFVNYPVTLMTHVRFFNVLKSNQKESNYLLHRLANSIVIIDELQSYPPLEWDKIRYFIDEYARFFNIKFILMSATLPKLDTIKTNDEQALETFIKLIPNKNDYFHNPNFRERVSFDFSLLKQWDIEALADKIHEICIDFERSNNDHIKAIVEFITKKSATEFLNIINKLGLFSDYKIFVLSGTILQPQRTAVIDAVKNNKHQKLLLICTQVVEAGVDIDMDIGFKDKSLLDNEEQFAGRINREASKPQSKVYLFNLDREHHIYGKDLRYQMMKTEEIINNYENILNEKNFDLLYTLVTKYINTLNRDEFTEGLENYKAHLQRLDFRQADLKFKIIDNESYSVFVPLRIPAKAVNDQLPFMRELGVYNGEDELCGEKIWHTYISIIKNDNQDFVAKKINLKRIYGVMSNFMFNVYSHQYKVLSEFSNPELSIGNILYLSRYEEVYSLESGINENETKKPYVFF